MVQRIAVVFLFVFAAAAQAKAASLLGSTVRITGERYEIGTVEVGPLDVVAGGGLEVPGNFWGIYSIDLTDTSILFNFPGTCCGGFSGGTFNGIHFFDLNGTIGDFTSVTIATSNVAGFNSSRISFDANNIYVNYQSLNPNPTDFVLLNVATASAVPEPASWLLIPTGILGVITARRRARATSQPRDNTGL